MRRRCSAAAIGSCATASALGDFARAAGVVFAVAARFAVFFFVDFFAISRPLVEFGRPS